MSFRCIFEEICPQSVHANRSSLTLDRTKCFPEGTLPTFVGRSTCLWGCLFILCCFIQGQFLSSVVTNNSQIFASKILEHVWKWEVATLMQRSVGPFLNDTWIFSGFPFLKLHPQIAQRWRKILALFLSLFDLLSPNRYNTGPGNWEGGCSQRSSKQGARIR